MWSHLCEAERNSVVKGMSCGDRQTWVPILDLPVPNESTTSFYKLSKSWFRNVKRGLTKTDVSELKGSERQRVYKTVSGTWQAVKECELPSVCPKNGLTSQRIACWMTASIGACDAGPLQTLTLKVTGCGFWHSTGTHGHAIPSPRRSSYIFRFPNV